MAVIFILRQGNIKSFPLNRNYNRTTKSLCTEYTQTASTAAATEKQMLGLWAPGEEHSSPCLPDLNSISVDLPATKERCVWDEEIFWYPANITQYSLFRFYLGRKLCKGASLTPRPHWNAEQGGRGGGGAGEWRKKPGCGQGNESMLIQPACAPLTHATEQPRRAWCNVCTAPLLFCFWFISNILLL